MKRVPAIKVWCLLVSTLFLSPYLPMLQAETSKGSKKSIPAKVKKSTPAKGSQKTPHRSKKPAPAEKPGGVYHTVKKGQTLFGISRVYQVSIEELVKANRLSQPSALKVGQRLFIPRARRALKVDPFKPLSAKERVEIGRSLEDEDMEGGEPPGNSPKIPSSEEVPGESIASLPKPSPEVVAKAGPEGFIWPLINRITSHFGPRWGRIHTGVDIAAPSYHEVVAAADGEVIYVQHAKRGLGNAVVLRHDNRYSTVYGHGVVILVKEGDSVNRGEPILGVGNTGHSTGNHLHFEVRKNGIPIDPLPLMPPTLQDLIDDLIGEKS